MKIFTCGQIREIDAETIKNEPVRSVDLMERAAEKVCSWLMERFPSDVSFLIFAGPGNNGGDGAAVARILHSKGKKSSLFIPNLSTGFSADLDLNLKRLESVNDYKVNYIHAISDFPEIQQGSVIVDALFGSGLTRPVIGLGAGIINMINRSDSLKVAIDIPSGLYVDGNEANMRGAIIRADHTLSFEFPKLAFMFPSSEEYTGKVEILPIELDKATIDKMSSPYTLIDSDIVSHLVKPRKKFSHKGTYGHALLIGGSRGKMGSVILGSKAALRAGVGLVTCHVPSKGNDILQVAVPEVMVSADWSDFELTGLPDLSVYSAVGAGPGMGTSQDSFVVIETLLKKCNKPLVLDADALNILSVNKQWLRELPVNCILTPHPREFERLAGSWDNDYQRLQNQINFSAKYNCIVILKGANSSVSTPDGSVWFNSTGNPGMATAGSGDVLTGIVLSLLAQNFTPTESAILGVYLHGLSGDIASEYSGEASLIASDIIEFMGSAYGTIEGNW